MADKTITIPDMTTTSGFLVSFSRRGTEIIISVTYEPTTGPTQATVIEGGDLTTDMRNAVRDLILAIIPTCRQKMGF